MCMKRRPEEGEPLKFRSHICKEFDLKYTIIKCRSIMLS
jgi:hypothetical protein